MEVLIKQKENVINIKAENIETDKDIRKLIHQLEHLEVELTGGSGSEAVFSNQCYISGGTITISRHVPS